MLIESLQSREMESPPPAAGVTCSVIIVSYKTRELTLRCLRVLLAQLQEATAEVWVVDNDSQDGTVEAIAAEMPEVKRIVSGTNGGFGAANNLAMRRAAGEFFLLLNSDAFLQPGAIDAMLRVMRGEARVGVVGPRLLNEDGSLQISCFRFPSPVYAWAENLGLTRGYRRWRHDQPRDVDWIVGACMLVRRTVFEQVGGFDERFFLYAEETDWQRRIRAAGWRIRFTPDARVMHLGRGSAGDRGLQIDGHFFDSLDLYEEKHHGLFGVAAVRMAMIVGVTFRAIFWSAIALFRPRSAAGKNAARRFQLALRQATHPPARAQGRVRP